MRVRLIILGSAVVCAVYSALILAALTHLVASAPGYWRTLAPLAQEMLAFQLALALFLAATAAGLLLNAWWARYFMLAISAMSILTGTGKVAVLIRGHARLQLFVVPALLLEIGVSWLVFFGAHLKEFRPHNSLKVKREIPGTGSCEEISKHFR